MNVIPSLILLVPFFLSPLFYPWPVILGFISSIVISQLLIIPLMIAYKILFNNKFDMIEDPMNLMYFSGACIFIGIIVNFIFIIPVYYQLSKQPYNIPVACSFTVFLSITMVLLFGLLSTNKVPWYGYIPIIGCCILHSSLAIWFISKYSLYLKY